MGVGSASGTATFSTVTDALSNLGDQFDYLVGALVAADLLRTYRTSPVNLACFVLINSNSTQRFLSHHFATNRICTVCYDPSEFLLGRLSPNEKILLLQAPTNLALHVRTLLLIRAALQPVQFGQTSLACRTCPWNSA